MNKEARALLRSNERRVLHSYSVLFDNRDRVEGNFLKTDFLRLSNLHYSYSSMFL